MNSPEFPGSGESEESSKDELALFLEQFGELDKELDDSTADTSTDALRVQFNHRSEEILGLVEARRIPTVLTTDEEHEAYLYRDFIDTWKEAQRKQRVWSPGVVHEGQLAVEAVIAYYNEREFQAMVVEAAALLQCRLENRDSWDAIALEVYAAKKELQGTFIVQYGRGVDDIWYKLFDELVPTEGLDLSVRPEDQGYIDMAMEGWDEFHEERLKRQLILRQAFQIIGLDVDMAGAGAIDAITEVVIEMRILASTPMSTIGAFYARREALSDMASVLFLDDDRQDELVGLFESAYSVWLIPSYDGDEDGEDEDEDEY